MSLINKISGIYGIINVLDSKIYVGKSVNINQRFSRHKDYFKQEKCPKNCNRHLYNSVKKYGIENFKLVVLEEISILDENVYKDRELYWMDFYKSCDRNHGYNLRRDSSTKMEVHEETVELMKKWGKANPNYGNSWTEEQKQAMSKIKKEQYDSGVCKVNKNAILKGIEIRNKKWKDNPELKEQMRENCSKTHSKNYILKLDRKTKEVLEIFESSLAVRRTFPVGYSCIFSTCNGYKRSYKGFLWRYKNKETGEIIEPIQIKPSKVKNLVSEE